MNSINNLLKSEAWRNTKSHIPLALGLDEFNRPLIADFHRMPHLLITGSHPGSGKAACLHAIIASLVDRFAPDELRLLMVDLKTTELQRYSDLPHLVAPIITNKKQTTAAAHWVVDEVEKRHLILTRIGVYSTRYFNQRAKAVPPPVWVDSLAGRAEADELVIPARFPYIVVILNEFQVLNHVCDKALPSRGARIRMMSRAAGVHCISAANISGSDNLTEIIECSQPARITFDMEACEDSAEPHQQPGNSALFYHPSNSSKVVRAKAAFISDTELQEIVKANAAPGKPNYEPELLEQMHAN
ncbi:MAG: FtsK/SpoIIIE domain-containing protein [Verrucomicrobiota bacterium]